jgi:hypothetical protein
MNMPQFTAQASIYRTSGRYHTSTSSGLDDLQHSQFVTLAYHPTSHARCDDCLTECVKNIPATFFTPWISWICAANCALGPMCCPKRCAFDLGDLAGGGCCDANEECVDPGDPNSRAGCCPSDQRVCGGRCCKKGDTCCGNECCPTGWFCADGFCTPSLPFSQRPPPPPPPPPISCPAGQQYCKGPSGEWVCCPPGWECCSDWVCRTTCVG